MTYGNHSAEVAPEDPIEEINIDFIRDQIIEKKNEQDPFSKVNIGNFRKNAPAVKRYETLRKQYRGVEGAEAKFIDPEQVYGYTLFDVVEPPYNLMALGQLYDESALLHAVVDARVMNTVGLGYGWEPTLKAKKQIERGSKNEDSADRVRTAHQKEQDLLNRSEEPHV